MYTRYMTSTIRVSNKVKEKIATFGVKGESYETIINRIYDIAVNERLKQFLLPSENFSSIDDAIKRARQKWSK